jgi:hypothetical protein
VSFSLLGQDENARGNRTVEAYLKCPSVRTLRS